MPCPGPYRQLSAAELTAPVEGESPPARNAAPDAASSADAGTSRFSDDDDEQDFDEEELMTTLSTKDVGGEGKGEYGRTTRASVAAPALRHRKLSAPCVCADGGGFLVGVVVVSLL